jgi:hypothetical protein
MTEKRTRSGARRIGDDYQDVVALELIVEMMEHPDRYEWIEVESSDAAFLDDVVALRKEGSFVYRQVKYVNHPDDPNEELTWELILHQKESQRGPLDSLLMKWSKSLTKIKEKATVSEAAFLTNRRASQQFESCFGDHHGWVDFDRIPDSDVKTQIIDQLTAEESARDFFEQFLFKLDQPDLLDLEAGARTRFLRLGGTEKGWLALKDNLRQWVRERNEPKPDGRITYEVAKHAADWRSLRPLPQQFEIPDDYVLPSAQFHQDFVDLMSRGAGKCFILKAPPGCGKSTYLSYLVRELLGRDMPVVRHHYFLSTAHRGEDRSLHRRVAESLMSDLESSYPQALGEHIKKNPQPEDLGEWVNSCGQYFSPQDSVLTIIIDGLDHVFRDQNSLDEVRSLLKHLLPVPNGVTIILGTQPLDESSLPSVLVRHVPEDAWQQLPTLDLDATRQWVDFHEQELLSTESQEPVTDIPVDSTVEEDRMNGVLDSLARAFYSVSDGHPLHLRYSLAHLQEQGLPISMDTIGQLPGCPHQDIESYYRELWNSLTESGKMILHLLTACRFTWPEQGVIQTLTQLGRVSEDVVAAFKNVRHLTVDYGFGLKPFHDSLLVYVETHPDHKHYQEDFKKAALGWLRSESAPEYLRWANEWYLSADLGDPVSLMDGPNREWALDSIIKYYPANEALRMLSRSCRESLRAGAPDTYLRVALLRDYLEDSYRSYDDLSGFLLGPLLALNIDPFMASRLDADLDYLAPSELVILAGYAEKTSSPNMVNQILNHLDSRRLRKDLTHDSYVSITEALLKVLAVQSDTKTAKVADFIIQHRKDGLSERFMEVFCAESRRCKKSRVFRELLKLELNDLERHKVEYYSFLLALEEGIDYGPLFVTQDLVTPFAGILRWFQSGTDSSSVHVPFPSLDYKDRQRTPVSMPWSSEASRMGDTFHKAFFCFLSNHLWEVSDQNQDWLKEIETASYDRRLIHHLELVACEVATAIQHGKQFSLADFFGLMHRGPNPWQGRQQDTWAVVQSAPKAVIRIGLDLLPILNRISENPPIVISQYDLERAMESEFCSPDLWMQSYLPLGRRWMDQGAVEWLLNRYETFLYDAQEVTTFSDRASDFSKLALLDSSHGFSEKARLYVQEAADNLLAYGYRKDIYLRDVLDMLVDCHEAGISNSLKKLLDLAPAVAHVEDFTDGAMTAYFPDRLAECLAEMDLELLSRYHRWLLSEEHYRVADHALHAYLKKADLSSEEAQALASTVVDPEGLKILVSRAKEGHQGASRIVKNAATYLGALPEAEDQSSLQSHTNSSEGDFKSIDDGVDPSEYPPDKFLDYLKRIRMGRSLSFDRHVRVESWLEHWSKASSPEEAFETLDSSIGRGVTFHISDEMFEMALNKLGKEAAFKWLVRAHGHNDGWRRDWGQPDYHRASRRWEIVRSSYPDRWLDFMTESLKIEDKYSLAHFGKDRFQRMISYCIFMDKKDLAEKLMETAVGFALELVSPIQLPVPGWMANDD